MIRRATDGDRGEAGMEILELHHVSLPTADLARSKAFYREVLGLAEIARPDFPFPGAWFRLGDRELHLIGGEAAVWAPDAGTHPRRLHLAVRVASFAAALARLEELGYRQDAPPGDPAHLTVQRRPPTGYPQIYLVDPDRHLIEINAAQLDG
jgi:catechol 2,3-dioxygenase-like lactoylglutathione lyase family enzyme